MDLSACEKLILIREGAVVPLPDGLLKKKLSTALEYPYLISLFVNEWTNLSEPSLSIFKNRRIAYVKQIQELVALDMLQEQLRSADSKITTCAILPSRKWLYNLAVEDEKINTIA
ncbi:hypothetical protein [Cellulophaga sp. Z1A5H]|uniref:hypothetical protein n=1 Tax=Cellulophaga sp. Z1A5H TaxID=2687291 RepID=UPI0013FDD752|nr:hypothetical protein [Cellulophaga sp. Z1A5H]